MKRTPDRLKPKTSVKKKSAPKAKAPAKNKKIVPKDEGTHEEEDRAEDARRSTQDGGEESMESNYFRRRFRPIRGRSRFQVEGERLMKQRSEPVGKARTVIDQDPFGPDTTTPKESAKVKQGTRQVKPKREM